MLSYTKRTPPVKYLPKTVPLSAKAVPMSALVTLMAPPPPPLPLELLLLELPEPPLPLPS